MSTRTTRVQGWWRSWPPAAAYVVTTVVMMAAALYEAAAGGQGARLTPVTVGVAVLSALTVVLARWAPLAAVLALDLVVIAPTLVLRESLPVGGAQLILSMLLVGHAAYRLPLRLGLVAYLVGSLVPPLSIAILGVSWWEFAFFLLLLAPAWAVGLLLRREQERSRQLADLAEELRRERERQAEVAVAAERTRISRELHDAVAHTVSVMTLQVGVVRRRLEVGTPEHETLSGAEGLGRQAVDELRRIVGLVREGESAALHPLPRLELLEDLVDQVRGTGTQVALCMSGDPSSVTQAVGISAYRVVQEGLTNALRHAPGAPVDVDVACGPAEVVVQVRNGPGRGVATGSGRPGGHGLVGLGERAQVLGGTLETGPTGDGGWRLRAVLPLVAAAAERVPEVAP